MRLLSPLFLAVLAVAACSKSSGDDKKASAPLPKGGGEPGAGSGATDPGTATGTGTGQAVGTATATGAEPGTGAAVGTGDGTARATGTGTDPGSGEVKAPPDGSGDKAPPGNGAPEGASKTTWQILDQEGAHGPDDTFNLAIAAPGTVAPGATARFELTVTPGAAYKINVCDAGEADCTPYPVKLELMPPAGVAVARPKLTQDDVVAIDKQHLVIAFEAVPDAAGTYQIPAKFKFAVCQDDFCKPRKLELSFALAAK